MLEGVQLCVPLSGETLMKESAVFKKLLADAEQAAPVSEVPAPDGSEGDCPAPRGPPGSGLGLGAVI